MTQIALAQEPLKVAIGSRLDPIAAKSRLFAPISHGVPAMALSAVLLVRQFSGRDALRPTGQWVAPRMILGRDVVPT